MNKLTITKTAKLSGAKYVRKSSSPWAQDYFYQTLEDAEQGMRINEIVFDIDEYIKILEEDGRQINALRDNCTCKQFCNKKCPQDILCEHWCLEMEKPELNSVTRTAPKNNIQAQGLQTWVDHNRPITRQDTGLEAFKGLVIGLAICAVFWIGVFYWIY